MTMNKVESKVNGRQRIMVIDNNQDMLKLLNRTLELEGFDTIVIDDYNEAANLLEELNPDLVIMDTFIPDINSIRTLDAMRERSDVPIIVISSDNEIDALKTIFAHGADDYVRKPFGIRPFIASIKAKLRRYHHTGLQPTY